MARDRVAADEKVQHVGWGSEWAVLPKGGSGVDPLGTRTGRPVTSGVVTEGSQRYVSNSQDPGGVLHVAGGSRDREIPSS